MSDNFDKLAVAFTEASKGFFAIFEGLKNGGFTEDQALAIIAKIVDLRITDTSSPSKQVDKALGKLLGDDA